MFEDKIKFVTKKDPRDRRDFRVAGIRTTSIPPEKHFDFQDDMPVKCQWSRGSCSAQGTAHHKERQEGVAGSARFVMIKSKQIEGNTNEWGYTRNGQKVIHNIGICNEEFLPEPSAQMSWLEYISPSVITNDMENDAAGHKSESFWRVDNNKDEIRQTLYEGKEEKRSVVVALRWYKGFNSRYIEQSGYVLPVDRSKWKSYYGGHLVEIIDYDDFLGQYKAKNSWGNGWGDDGYFYIPYAIFNKVAMDIYTSLDYPQKFPVDDRYGRPRTWQSYLKEKAVAFNAWLFGKIHRLPSNREISALAYGYWSFQEVFRGSAGDAWLHKTKPQYLKENGLLRNN